MTKEYDPVLDAAETFRLDLRGVKLIEASAGTGKTYAIGNLYLRYILESYKVSQILVVTFTNAATEELRGRIRQRLNEALQFLQAGGAETSDQFFQLMHARASDGGEAGMKQVIDRLKLAVRTMDEAAIFTIHGFCQRALTDYAFNSGQPFNVVLAQDDDLLWEEAIKDWWRKCSYDLCREDLALFEAALPSLSSFIKQQTHVRTVAEESILPRLNETSVENRRGKLKQKLASLAKLWREQSEEIKTILLESKVLSRSLKSGYRPDDLAECFAQWDAYFGSGNNDDLLATIPARLCCLSSAYIDQHSKPSQRGQDPKLTHEFFGECQTVMDDVDGLHNDYRIQALLEATRYGRRKVDEVKKRNHSLAFNDQLTRLFEGLNGDQGEALAGSLRQNFPVALIDEFQDTDAIQYGIFRKLYFEQPELGLVMIGDPKQAIYSFRGGDIFTYMAARTDAAGYRYTLDTNWRSVPTLIEAVNRLFSHRESAFIYDDAIEFYPVKPAPRPASGVLNRGGKPVVPLSIWQIPPGPKDKPLSKTKAAGMVHDATADEIAVLISEGSDGILCLGEKAVVPGDIAVLVRTGFEGAELRARLAQRGISAITVGGDKVFDSAEASGLLALLRGVVQFSDRDVLRCALASELLNYDYAAMADIIDTESGWLGWQQQMRELQQTWQRKGFMSMFQLLMQTLKIGVHASATDDAERRLTNLIHLSELLQQVSKTRPGQESLLSWLQQQIQGAAEGEVLDQAELRLESDEALVKIVTIHASKGLEYPIVFVPYLWACTPSSLSRTGVVRFHDSERRLRLDAGSDAIEQNLLLAEKERLAEDVRLAYVALTRARARVYLAWGNVGTDSGKKVSSCRTALAWLFHHAQSPDEFSTKKPQAFDESFSVGKDLLKLAEGEYPIEVTALPENDDIQRVKARQKPGHSADQRTLEARQFSGHVASDWRITSFSALTRDIHQVPHGGQPRRGDDPVMDFPAGSHVGLFLHLLLEHLDFAGDIAAQTAKLTRQLAPRFGLSPESQMLAGWMQDVVTTAIQPGLSLSDLSEQERLNELEFDFSAGNVDLPALNHILEQAAAGRAGSSDDCGGRFPPEPLRGENFRGMITGIIDLVFEHEGRFYVVDYKSNFLGAALSDYSSARLRQTMLDRRYDLQAYLYALALHRYLKQRIPDYSYTEHFGGVYYLFLRGMRPDTASRCGVYFDLPEESLIDALDTGFGTESERKRIAEYER